MNAFNDFLTWLASDVLCPDREADPDMEDPSAALACGCWAPASGACWCCWSEPTRELRRLSGSAHPFKYRLAYVVNEGCVLRYDNEAGKGDHRHWGDKEFDYRFSTPEK